MTHYDSHFGKITENWRVSNVESGIGGMQDHRLDEVLRDEGQRSSHELRENLLYSMTWASYLISLSLAFPP